MMVYIIQSTYLFFNLYINKNCLFNGIKYFTAIHPYIC